MREDDFEIRPSKGRSGGNAGGRSARTLVGQIQRLARKAGYTRLGPGARRTSGTGRSARGQGALLKLSEKSTNRRVVIKARIVRHTGARFRAAPLSRHMAYLERDGVTRDGRDAALFDAGTNAVDRDVFAERCGDDRHHFRFIVSPEDASELEDVRSFTRGFMADMSADLGSKLDWVAVDHWNTDNPHVHILLRGKLDDGKDLVIVRDYIKTGMRLRAEERVTLELGPRSEREMALALSREVDADRWTSLDRGLQRMADDHAGIVDLRPGFVGADPGRQGLLIGRATKLERMGLAERVAPACWTLKPRLESTLRDLSIRGDIIKTMHRAMTKRGHDVDPSTFAVHASNTAEPIIGRLVARGLHDELVGDAYAIVDGVDGRTHHLRFSDLDMTGDAKPGAIVELRSWADAKGKERLSLATRSDLPLEAQIKARGATWVDRQLIAKEPLVTGHGFGAELRSAMADRADHLVKEGLARRQGQRLLFARDLIDTLRARELTDIAKQISERTGLEHRPTSEGKRATGIYRERMTLASGRFAMIDNGMGFELVPWRPAMDQHLGERISGVIKSGGGIELTIGRKRGLGI